mgnify:CR=1 FL=1
MEIWLRQEGVEYGPYTLAQVKEFVASGESVMEDEAWFDGCEDYLTVGDALFYTREFTSKRKVIRDTNVLLQWMATGYHIALIFENDICQGVSHEFAG